MNLTELMPLMFEEKPKKKERRSTYKGGQGSTIMLTYQGKTQSLKDWAIELNKPVGTLRYRYMKGWNIEKILSTEDYQLESRQSHHWRKANKTLSDKSAPDKDS